MRSEIEDTRRLAGATAALGGRDAGASAADRAARGPARRSRIARRVAGYGAVLLATLGGVWYATRGQQEPTPAAGAEHQHGATSGGQAAQPVTLNSAQARRIGVTYAVAAVGPLQREIRVVGQITYDETRVRTIAPKIDGFVEQLFVNATGQPVAVGQRLLTIYSPMLVTAQEELLLAKRLEGDVKDAASDTRQGAADLRSSARRRLAYWDIPSSEIDAIERSGQVRKTLTLRASAGGYVLEKNVVAGQRIMAGDALYRVADLSQVWIEGEVFEQDLAGVRVGQLVHADFQALPGEHRMGHISYIYPTINPETRTARVRVVLANPGLRLKPGMYATLRIAGTERGNVLTVPRGAVLVTGERNLVFVKDPASGQLVPHEVALGVTNDERVEVLRGLNAGDTVVASATFLVDAESNLGKAAGGMGDMPGMEVSAPPKKLPMQGTTPPTGAADHSGHTVQP